MRWSKQKFQQRQLQLDDEERERERAWRERVREELKQLPPAERARWKRYLKDMGR